MWYNTIISRKVVIPHKERRQQKCRVDIMASV